MADFKKGNPGGPGRPRMDPVVRDMLEAASPAAAKALCDALGAEEVVTDSYGVVLRHSPDHDMRVRAAEAIMNRLYGKPAQAITGADDGPLQIDLGLVEMLRKLAQPDSGE